MGSRNYDSICSICFKGYIDIKTVFFDSGFGDIKCAHRACFKCSICNSPLNVDFDTYFLFDRKLFCGCFEKNKKKIPKDQYKFIKETFSIISKRKTNKVTNNSNNNNNNNNNNGNQKYHVVPTPVNTRILPVNEKCPFGIHQKLVCIYCIDCKKSVCIHCVLEHRFHKLKDLEEFENEAKGVPRSYEKCLQDGENHHVRPLILYDQVCRKVICSHCLNDHSHHTWKDIHDHFREHQYKYPRSGSLPSFDETISQLLETFGNIKLSNDKSYQESVQEPFETASVRLKSYFATLHDLLHYKEVELKRELESYYNEDTETLLLKQTEIDHDTLYLSNFIDQLHQKNKISTSGEEEEALPPDSNSEKVQTPESSELYPIIVKCINRQQDKLIFQFPKNFNPSKTVPTQKLDDILNTIEMNK
ncbi:hypothetical protein DLAC_02189 [Tieghemostelium lacteum]|uniref:LIM zinc-binding domain-containing protein n=1 Tax=Tieghemostelium lacteum TaxID=361077 RepID=A0A152A4C1_TIELA|nr:hypothetical protein DLAC_02189 [Tieghemostelium lacteum]|eukprot:KYR01090.1 hypothetical protein DLAC_02189 [Tieghemostelium lacteum]